MDQHKTVLKIRQELHLELESSILPWWLQHMDSRGGWFGKLNHDGSMEVDSPKGLVMHARFLWTYARAYRKTPRIEWLQAAQHGLAFLRTQLFDKDHGGYFWGIDSKGKPLTNRKIVYGQVFALYALSEYALTTGDQEVKKEAIALFELLESNARDWKNQGYFEAVSQDWKTRESNALGEEDSICDKSMNTNLHVLEAYTTFFDLTKSPQAREALEQLIVVHFEKILVQNNSFGLYFDEGWHCHNPEIRSFGHDIEAAWLLHDAIKATGLTNDKYTQIIQSITENTLELLHMHQGSLPNEAHGKILDTSKIWWVQAETMVGLALAWETHGEARWIHALDQVWTYIKQHIKDHSHGEWLWGRNPDGSIMDHKDKGGFWKTSYHNGRSCIEVLERLSRCCH